MQVDRSVNPDEAVALGCAIQVGVLDGVDGATTVLNPMQAAVLRAAAEQQEKQGSKLSVDDAEDCDDEFSDVASII